MDVAQSSDRRRLGWLLAGVGMLSVSTDSLWIRLSEADAIDVSFWVACCSVPLYTALSHRIDGCWPLEAFRRHPWQQLVIGFLTGGSQLCFVIAVTQTRVANVVAIVAAVPLLAAVCAWIWLRERISRSMAIAIAITMAGIGAIVSSSVGEPTLTGDLLGVLAIVGFSVSLTMWRRYPDMSRLVGLSIGGVMTVVALAYSASPLSLDVRAYLSIAAMGLVFNPFGRLALSNAPRFAPVADVALFAPIETVAGTIWAAAFFNELPRPVAAVGAVIVLVGVLYGTVATTRAQVSASAG
ncbi:MAG: DMT family transporter [Acidimicrobiia bacterium]|nr:DMT family transporter [Acidimicrobiia bacterium]MCY4432615.1 DMT family transporter [bacterium]